MKDLEIEEKTPVILVVDDNQQNLELLQAYLEEVDCEILAAMDGQGALTNLGAWQWAFSPLSCARDGAGNKYLLSRMTYHNPSSYP